MATNRHRLSPWADNLTMNDCDPVFVPADTGLSTMNRANPEVAGTVNDPDADLMRRVQADEPGAFEDLVARYQHRVLAFLGHQVVARDDAEDLAQEVFLRLYKARRRYRARSRFSTWLFAIAKNLARNSHRTRQPVLLSCDDDGDQFALPLVERLAPHREAPPSQRMERQELVETVRRAVDGLKKRQRQAIMLHKFDGLAYADIAHVMGLTPQAVKSLLMRARENLRLALEGHL